MILLYVFSLHFLFSLSLIPLFSGSFLTKQVHSLVGSVTSLEVFTDQNAVQLSKLSLDVRNHASQLSTIHNTLSHFSSDIRELTSKLPDTSQIPVHEMGYLPTGDHNPQPSSRNEYNPSSPSVRSTMDDVINSRLQEFTQTIHDSIKQQLSALKAEFDKRLQVSLSYLYFIARYYIYYSF